MVFRSFIFNLRSISVLCLLKDEYSFQNKLAIKTTVHCPFICLKLSLCTLHVILSEVGKRNFFLSPQSQFHNLKEALPQSQFRNFLKKCCSATATPQLRNRNFVWSPELQVRNLRASIPQFSAYFCPWNPVNSWRKNRRQKISCYCPFKASFCFPEKQRILKIFLVDF